MKRIVIILIGLISVAYGQSQPTSSKTRFVNGLYAGTKLDSYFAAADSNAIYWRADSSLMAKYKGTARRVLFVSDSATYLNQVVRTFGTQTVGGVKTFSDTLRTARILSGASSFVGTEQVQFKADITNTLNNVVRAGQFYSTQQGNQSFTGIDVQSDAQNTAFVDHVATNQNNTKLNNTGELDKAWGVYHVGDKLSGAGVVNKAYGFYHAGWGGTIGKKWSFYAAADYMFLSSTSGIAMNTFTPQELIDMENGNANGLGAKFNNAWVGNWNSAGSFASFGHYGLKATGASIALLQASDGETYLNAASGKSVFFDIGISNKGRITPSGNWQIGDVDISTVDDLRKLQVLGSAKIRDTVIAKVAYAEKIVGASSTPSVSGGDAAYIGTSATLSVTGNDAAGKVTLVTGTGTGSTGASNREAFTITFTSTYNAEPIVLINVIVLGGTSATDTISTSLFIRSDGVNANGFTVYIPAGVTLTSSTSYEVTYHVIGRQVIL